MNKLLQFLNYKLSVLPAVSVILAAIVLYWMFNRYAMEFFVVLFSILLATSGLLIYLLVAWRRLSENERLSIGLIIVAWLLVFYGVIHANGLSITSLMWWQG